MATELSHITEHTFVSDIKRIVEQGRNAAYGAVNVVMIETYWHIGRRIVEQEQNGIYTYDRREKFDAARLRAIFSKQPSWAE